MKEQSAAGILETTIEKVKNLVNVSTIIGDPMTVDGGITIIPVSKVTYGFASGGSDFPSKSNKEIFGGGGGAAKLLLNTLQLMIMRLKELLTLFLKCLIRLQALLIRQRKKRVKLQRQKSLL